MKLETRSIQSQFTFGEQGRAPAIDEDTTEVTYVVFPSDAEVARAGVSLGGTVNMGNYSSLRYDVSVNLPCLPGEVGAALERAQAICDEKASEIAQAAEAAKGRR